MINIPRKYYIQLLYQKANILFQHTLKIFRYYNPRFIKTFQTNFNKNIEKSYPINQMQQFNIFQAGGRQKFLKKKKEKKARIESENKQLSQIQIVQKNIQRFLELKKAHEKYKDRLELEGEQANKQDLWHYWLLTSYHVRTFNSVEFIIRFWQRQLIDRNQVQNLQWSLINRMVKLTIQFLQQLLKIDLQITLRICRLIFQLVNSLKYKLTSTEAKSMLHDLSSSQDKNTQKLGKQLLDILFRNSETKLSVLNIFENDLKLIEYLMMKSSDAFSNKKIFLQIEEIVCVFYPQILEKRFKKIQLQEEETNSWTLNNFNSISNFYGSMLHYLEHSSRSPQATLVLIAFMNNLTSKIKRKTLQQIHTKFKINPNIFESQQVYQQYLDEKEEYMIFREILMGDYEKTKDLMKKAIQVIMNQRQCEIQAKDLIYEEGMSFVNEILVALGDADVVSLNKAVNFFVQNVSESMIYGLGKQNVFTFGKNNFTLQSKLLLVLTIAQKAALQTPDLHFTKFYQQPAQKQKLRKLIKEYLLKTLKHTIFLPQSTSTIQRINRTTISLLENLYNKIFRTNVLSTEIFENSSFAAKFKSFEWKTNVKDEVSMFLTQFPYVFPLPERAWKFRQILRNQRYRYSYYGHGYHNDDNDSDDQHWNRHVRIRRNYEFVDAFEQLKKRELRKNFKITFINQFGLEQKGIDAGGLTKQFLNRVLKDALNPNYGMFIENDAHELLPHPIKAELKEGIETQFYQFIGKLIGLAIYHNITLGYKFSGTFLNAIVGKKNTFDDLKTIDPDLYKSLVYIKDMQEDASQLSLTFLYNDGIRKKNIQLLPNGHQIPVTNQNKRLYISLLTAYKVNRLLEHQTRFIRKGLTSMINKEWLFMFNYEQLNYIISGQGVIDVEDLRAYTKVIGFENKQSKTIKHFWEVVKEFTEEQKSKLLMFVTACPRPSFLGFKELSPPFTIMCLKNQMEMLPISHTCSNVLELPDYNNKEILKNKLLTAIESNAGFEFG